MASPLTADAAVSFVQDWVDAPAAWIPEVTASTWSVPSRLLATTGATGNLMPDAQLAALAIERGVPIVSADSDFARFRPVVWINPFA